LRIDAICIGSGRFLRSVLVPVLVQVGYHPVIIQTRGRSFLDYTLQIQTNQQALAKEGEGEGEGKADIPNQFWPSDLYRYEVETVHYDGTITIDKIPYYGAGTLGTHQGKQDVLNLCSGNGDGGRDGDGDGDDNNNSNGIIPIRKKE